MDRRIPLDLCKRHLQEIYNYRRYNDSLSTSGQPTEKQFGLIREAGFGTVINLAPHSAENALKDEAAALSKLGISYVHIPVDYTQPTEADFQKFSSTLESLGNRKTWVHCAANMRVSAFLYRYRRDVLGMADAVAREIMDSLWKPTGVWAEFVQKT